MCFEFVNDLLIYVCLFFDMLMLMEDCFCEVEDVVFYFFEFVMMECDCVCLMVFNDEFNFVVFFINSMGIFVGGFSGFVVEGEMVLYDSLI